jgi:deoxyribonuclease-4
MVHIGAHVSISDGFEEAVSAQDDLGGNVGQIFVGSPLGWSVKTVTDDDAKGSKTRLKKVI